MAEFGLVTNMETNEENSLDIFEMSNRTNEINKGGGEQGVVNV
jgi:hypothetical protein